MHCCRLWFTARLVLGLVWAALPTAVVAQARVEPKPTAAEFKAQIKRLDQKNAKVERLEAVKWLCRHVTAKDAYLAMPALEQCIRNDPVAKVRENAIEALGFIAKERQKVCPLVIVEAMLDKDLYVSQVADALAGHFKSYPPGSVKILLRCARSESTKLRSDCLYHLGRIAKKDKRALEAIAKARQGKSFSVRHNAHCAMFQANDNLEEFLTYFAQLQDDPDGTLGQVDRTSEAGKQEPTARNVVLVGSAVKIAEWCNKRGEELAPVLLKLLASPSPRLRRCAARWIGAAAVKVDPDAEWNRILNKQPQKAVQPAKPAEKSPVAIRLEKLKVIDRLRELRDNDPEQSVRIMARYALERFASVQQKKDGKGGP